ncbi:MAG: hypothetical protein AB8H80_01140 [Planctomycetota bacterium]
MHPHPAAPWFDSAIARLEARKGNRLLALAPRRDEAQQLLALIGKAGELTLVLTDEALADDLAGRDWPGLRLLLLEATGEETFGTFDSLLICPTTGPVLPADACATLVRKNLRPGGRFVVDVPAPDMVPDLRAAWLELGWDEERLQPISGPSDIEVVDAMRTAGLRGVESSLGSHLLHVPSAGDLVASFATPLGLTDAEEVELRDAVVRHRKDAHALDALVHRTQVSGQR